MVTGVLLLQLQSIDMNIHIPYHLSKNIRLLTNSGMIRNRHTRCYIAFPFPFPY